MPQRLAQHLIARGLLKASTVDEAMRRMARQGGSLDTNLLEMSVISEAGMLQAISDSSGVRLVNLADFEPNAEAAPMMPFKMAKQLEVVPLSVDGVALHIACTYPIPEKQLKDVGFLLGRKLELWVSLEARVKNWQSLVYGQPLEARVSQLLAALDPVKRPSGSKSAATVNGSPSGASNTAPPRKSAHVTSDGESLSSEVLERIARGIVDEPVLLSVPKKKKKGTLEVTALPPVELGSESDDSKTSVVDPLAYSRFAKVEASKTGLTPALVEEEVAAAGSPRIKAAAAQSMAFKEEVTDPTRLLDTDGYEKFAREVTKARELPPLETPHTEPAATVRFPGGVAPPRRSAPPPAAAKSPGNDSASLWIRPALPSRPTLDRSQSTANAPAVRPLSSPPVMPMSPPPAPAPSAPPPVASQPVVSAPPAPSAPAVPKMQPAASSPSALSPSSAAPPIEAWAGEESPLIEATVISDFTEVASDETDFSDVDSLVLPKPLSTAPPPIAPVQPAPAAPTAEREAERLAAEPPAPLAPATSPPSPLPQRSEPWHMMQPGALMPPPTPLAPAVPLAGVPVHYTPNDPNISQSPPGPGAANAAEWTLAQARQSLKEASQDREHLVAVMLEYGRRTFEYVSAFAVMRGAAYGWDARGDGDLSPIREMAIPLDAASVFRTVALTRGSYVGPLPPDSLTQHYLALLGRSPRTVFVWPIEVQSRLVAVLYGDCGARPVSQRRLSDFILFCQDLPAAFHDLIVFRKLNPPAPQQYDDEAAYAAQSESQEYAGGYDANGEAPPTDADWFHGLMSLLTGPDPSERSMAMVELLKTPEASAHALAAAFPGPTGWSRLPVVELPEPDELGPIPGALSRLGAMGAAALAPLLDSADSDTRYLALLTAGSLRSPDVIDGVMRGLFDLEPDISSAARSAAAWLRYLPEFEGRMPDLRQELAASDPLRKSLAARALGVLHDREAVDGLINLTSSEDELCATSAAEALKEVTRASFNTNTRAWSAWWAGAKSKRRIEWIIDALGSDDFDLRLSAIEELSRTFGDNHGFFADGPREEREAAVSTWRNAVAERPDIEL